MARSSGESGFERFNGLLLRHRGRTRLTQTQLAERVGVSLRTVQGWETGLMYPSTQRLQALIAALLAAGGMTAGRESEDANALWAAVERDSARVHPPFDRQWFAALLADGAAAQVPLTKPEPGSQPSPAVLSKPATELRSDWGDAPALQDFVGRSAEVSTLRRWVVDERCRLLGLYGMGGIGKTSVAAKLAREVAPEFTYSYWRGLRNAPLLVDWLKGAIRFLSGQQQAPPDTEAEQLTVLLQILRDRACLLVLDNFETLLEPGQQAANYRPGFEGYGELLRAVGQTGHQSCLIVTSREAPPDWAMLSGGAVRTLGLDGLDVADCQLLLAQKDLSGTAPEWITLIHQYRGNGLALKLVAETIRQVFSGEISAFLSESSSGAVFGGIRRLVAEQLARSSPLEQRVLQVLAVEREPVTMAQLLTELGAGVGRGPLVESMAALRQRSLVERAETAGAAAFTLPPVLLEYLTDRLVQDVCEAIRRAQPGQLAERPLIKAQANDYVRQAQERLIGEPILQQLRAEDGPERIQPMLLALLEGWRSRPPAEQGYGPGNVLNLLRLLRHDLRGLSFAGLTLQQAYLAGTEAQDANFAQANLSRAVLTESFNFPLSVALSEDGAFLAAGTSAGEVLLWRVADRTPLVVVQAHAGPVRGIALSADGRLIATGSEDGTVCLWKAPEGHRLARLLGHTSPVQGVALSRDGQLLASGSFDGTIRLWDVTSGQVRATIERHASPVCSVALSADAQILATGSLDGSMRLWDPGTGQLRAAFDGVGSPVWSVSVSADNQLVASGTEDATIRVWEAGSRQLLVTLQSHAGSVRGVALSTDGHLLGSASWDRTIRIWETRTWQPVSTLEGHTGPVRAAALSADGHLVASGSVDGSVRLWESRTGRPLATFEGHTSPVYGVALSADGRLLASGNWNGTVGIWETTSGDSLSILPGHTRPVYSVALSRDGRQVASGSWDRTARVWRVTDGQALATLHGHTGGVRSVALSQDGRLLATGSWDSTVRLWEAPDWQPGAILRGHSGGVRSVALSETGRLLASGSLDATIRLWDTADGRLHSILEGHVNPVYAVAFAADGALLASGGWDGTVRLWRTQSGDLETTVQAHTGEIRSVALSADGRLLASGGFDGLVRLWEAPGGRPVATLEGHTSPVYGVAMSQDGRLLASGGFDGTVRLWNTDTGACVRMLPNDRPYERADITGITGVTSAQRNAMLALGAVDQSQG